MKSTNKPIRQKMLEEFLNDEVEKLSLALYKWRGRYYEVISRGQALKRHNWSQFVRLRNPKYMMREASEDIIKKYHPTVVLTNN